MTPAAPPWVVLQRRLPRDDIPSAQAASISVELKAPPHIAELVVPRSLVGGGSRVLAADPSGFLLFSSSVPTPLASDEPAGTSYHIWDAVLKTSCSVPAPETLVSGACTAGLIAFRGTFGHHELMVAELVLSTGGSDAATLRCFSTKIGRWFQKTLSSPPMKFPWYTAHVQYYHGRLWWIDLLQGLLAFHPSAEDPKLHFVPLPSCYRVRGCSEESLRKGLSNYRCLNLSRGKLRFVVISRHNSEPKIKLWTLADHEAGKWVLNYEVAFEDIWADERYEATSLPKEKPVLAFVHPNEPCVVYLFLKGHLFGVDLLKRAITESASIGRCDDEPSGSPLLSWELTPALRTASSDPSPAAESQSTSAFDNIAQIFYDAYNRELDYVAFHQFAKIALASLNRKNKKTQENKYKLSERLLLQYFDEIHGTRERRYAHLNLYADCVSGKVLVFAEFHTNTGGDDDPDDWTLSSCKILTRNFHGGLYGSRGIDVGQSNGSRKRKNSFYCTACEPEMLHPTCGFEGGYGGSAT